MNAQAHFDSDSRRPLQAAGGLASEGGNSEKRRTQELLDFQSKPLPQANQASCSGGICAIGDWKPKRQA